ARPRLDRSEGDAEVRRDLGLRESAPVGELDHVALALRQVLQRAVDTPGDPVPLGEVGRAGLVRLGVGSLDGGLVTGAAAVDDRVPGDREEPRASRAALGAIAAGRA